MRHLIPDAPRDVLGRRIATFLPKALPIEAAPAFLGDDFLPIEAGPAEEKKLSDNPLPDAPGGPSAESVRLRRKCLYGAPPPYEEPHCDYPVADRKFNSQCPRTAGQKYHKRYFKDILTDNGYPCHECKHFYPEWQLFYNHFKPPS
jgi:hypothetical protein